MILEGEIKDVKMSSVSSEVQKFITHKFPSYFLHKLLISLRIIIKESIVFTQNIIHLVHAPPPKKKTHAHTNASIFYITIVFDWDDCDTQEKLETMVIQNLGGKQGAFIWSIFLQFYNFLWR